MAMDELDEVYRVQRFLPTDEEAVGYFLRCLLTGETLDGAEKLIHHADIYTCEPKDLAARYPPVPTAVSTGDRFFFTTCKSKNAKNKKGPCERHAGAGTWTVQTTKDVHDDKGVKIGQARTVSFKKQKKSTGWVMEEYRSLLPQAIVADGEKVLCRIHLSQHAPAAARQESNAYKIRPQQGAEPAPAPQPAEPVTVMAIAHARKRPAPVAAVDDMSSCKKMRIAAPAPVPAPETETVYEDCPVWPTPVAAADPPCSVPAPAPETEMGMSVPAPASDEGQYDDCPVWFTPAVSTVPAAFPPEANEGRLSCSWVELFGEEHQVLDQGMEMEPISWESDVRGEEQQDMDHFVQSLLADESEVQQAFGPIEAQNKIQQLASDELRHSEEKSIDWESFLAENIDIGQLLDDLHEVQKKSCNPYNADLQGQQHSHFFSFAPVN